MSLIKNTVCTLLFVWNITFFHGTRSCRRLTTMRSISTTTCRTTDSCMTLSRSIWTALTAVFSPIRAVGWVLTCQKLRGRASQCGDPCCFLPVLMDFRSRCMIFVVSDKSSLIRPWLVFRRFWMRFFDEIMLSGVPGHVGVDVILLIMPKLREKRLGLSRYYSVFMIFLCLFSSSQGWPWHNASLSSINRPLWLFPPIPTMKSQLI